MKIPEGFTEQEWAWVTTIKEAHWVSQLVQAARLAGWLRNHQRNAVQQRPDGTVRHLTATQGDVGFPDLTLVYAAAGDRPVRLAFLEAKTWARRRNVDPTQADWLIALRHAGVCAAVVTPADDAWVKGLLVGHPATLHPGSLFGPGTLTADAKLVGWTP